MLHQSSYLRFPEANLFFWVGTLCFCRPAYFLREEMMNRLLSLAILFIASTCFAQGVLDPPRWNYDERLTDKQKLEQLERKATYEQKRAADFTARGIRTYTPATSSLKIALPSTRQNCLKRLEQLNRIAKHLSRQAKVWYHYEFDVISDHFDRLNR